MHSILSHPQRCIKCGLLAIRLYAYGDRYICDACLPHLIREIMPGLSAVELDGIVQKMRTNFAHSPVDTRRKRGIS